MIYGYDINGIMAILGKAVVANNRLLEDLQIRDEQIIKLKQEIEQLEKEKLDGRLGPSEPTSSLS